ncbi:MAG: ribonuclease HII, partial [Anaerovorax sp.]
MNREEKLTEKLKQMKQFEEALYAMGSTYIAGVDEVGRGPLAGPVVAAAVVLPRDFQVLGIDDSKKLSEKKREELYEKIKSNAICYGIGQIQSDIIDEINILEGTKLAMKLALSQANENLKAYCRENPSIEPCPRGGWDDGKDQVWAIDHVLIDALTLKEVPVAQTGIIKGDTKSVSIAAASILAKVT